MFSSTGLTVRAAQELHVARSPCARSLLQLSAPNRSIQSAWVEPSSQTTKLRRDRPTAGTPWLSGGGRTCTSRIGADVSPPRSRIATAAAAAAAATAAAAVSGAWSPRPVKSARNAEYLKPVAARQPGELVHGAESKY